MFFQELNIDAIIRMFVHIVLENNPVITVKVFEMGEIEDSCETYLCHSIVKALADLPLIQVILVTIFLYLRYRKKHG